MQASCQSLPSGLRVALSGTAQGSFLDDSTSCYELLLEPSALEVVLEHRPSSAGESMNRNGREGHELEKSSEPLAITGRLPAGNAPAQPCLTLLLRCAALSPNKRGVISSPLAPTCGVGFSMETAKG